MRPSRPIGLAATMRSHSSSENGDERACRCISSTPPIPGRAPSYCPSCQVYRSRLPSSSELYEPTLGRHLHVKALPRLNEDGEIQGIVHVVRDITALKDAEHREEHLHSQLVKAQRMESVGRLAGGREQTEGCDRE